MGPHSKNKEGGGVTCCPRVKEEVGPIEINLYRRHLRPEAIFLFVGPYSKKMRRGRVACCPKVKEEVGPSTNKPTSKTAKTRHNIFICGFLHKNKEEGVP